MGRLVNTADINNVLMSEKSNYGVFAVEIDHIISGIVSKCPTIEQEPKTGHWINVNKGKWNTIPANKCSVCGENAALRNWSGKSPFCPWCGAKMVEPQESEG